MYNFALAFFICAAAYIIGEVVSTLTKAWVPSVFVTAIIMLVGYWTFVPTNVVTDATLLPFGSTLGLYLIITHMGTVISIKQLLEQWKTIVACLVGLAGMTVFALLLCPLVMDRTYVISGLPPLTGGIVAATTMMDAAQAKGLKEAAIFAITMYCVQGFAGYPLTAVCLQLEGKKLLKQFKPNAQNNASADGGAIDTVNGNLVGSDEKTKKLLPEMSPKWNTTVMMLAKLGLVAFCATVLGSISFPVIGKISGAIWALLLGIIFTTIGFLDENSLNKSNSYGIVMFALMMYIFDGLKDCTPEMLMNMIVPMLILIVIGVAGMAIFCFIIAKVLKRSFCMCFATALTALYGFPPNAVITENTCTALAKTPEEKAYLMDHMFPPMIVGGFTTVTITSVLIAGAFATML